MAPTSHRIFVGKDVHKFSSAHMTVFPDGSKERIHGHNFQVTVGFDLLRTDFGHMLDFGIVKKLIVELCDSWDQRLLLAEFNPRFELIDRGGPDFEFKLCGKRYVVPTEEIIVLPLENVIVETLAEAFAKALVAKLGPNLKRDVVAGLEVNVTESNHQGGTFRWAWEEA